MKKRFMPHTLALTVLIPTISFGKLPEKVPANPTPDQIAEAAAIELSGFIQHLVPSVDIQLFAKYIVKTPPPYKISIKEQQVAAKIITKANKIEEERLKKIASKNQKLSNEILQKAALEKGAKKTPTGLVYKVINQGSGNTPQKSDIATMSYKATLSTGKVAFFTDKGQYKQHRISQLPKGWVEALTHMKAGSTWKIVIPPKLAFGARGNPVFDIGPNTAISMTLTLKSFKPGKSKKS